MIKNIVPIILGALPMSICFGVWEGIVKYTKIKWYLKVLALPLLVSMAFGISFLCLWIWWKVS